MILKIKFKFFFQHGLPFLINCVFIALFAKL
nr:MAG TPA: hypothetical protein [Caudoviricetes sp.]